MNIAVKQNDWYYNIVLAKNCRICIANTEYLEAMLSKAINKYFSYQGDSEYLRWLGLLWIDMVTQPCY